MRSIPYPPTRFFKRAPGPRSLAPKPPLLVGAAVAGANIDVIAPGIHVKAPGSHQVLLRIANSCGASLEILMVASGGTDIVNFGGHAVSCDR